MGTSTLVNKRDSFGKSLLPAASSSRSLDALIEEEEEEEEEEAEEVYNTSSSFTEEPEDIDECSFATEATDSSVLSASSSEPTLATSASTQAHRSRPMALNLHAAPTTAFGKPINVDYGLPTPPAATPSPRPGLRPLTLTSSPFTPDVPISRRMSLTSMNSTPSSSDSGIGLGLIRRPSAGSFFESPSPAPPAADKPKRPLSIAYKSGDTPPQIHATLPTPEMTPITSVSAFRAAHASSGSESSNGSTGRPTSLSLSEQHFLFKSHNALLARIEDLEHALAGRSSSSLSASRRPSSLGQRSFSMASDDSEIEQDPEENLNDEMIQLVADLKAERDELKQDVDGWRTRVSDYEKQVGVLVRRIEGERRDAWVARERAGILEVEKNAAQRALDAVRIERERMERNASKEKAEMEEQLRKAEAEVAVIRQVAQQETDRLRVELEAEQMKVKRLEIELDAVHALATPKPFVTNVNTQVRKRGLGFQSIDSQVTDVDSLDGECDTPVLFKLGAVQEEDEDADDNVLLHYEDDDEDYGIPAPYDDSEDEDRDSMDTYVKTPVVSSTAYASHTKKASLGSWTFPKVAAPVPVRPRLPEEVDHFFSCLDEYESDKDALAMTEERGKNIFCQLANDDEEELPFYLPSNVGVEVETAPSPSELEAVQEDAEEDVEDESHLHDFGGVEVEGGIRFEFSFPAQPPSPPQPIETPVSPPSHALTSPSFGGFMPAEDSDDDEDEVFSFPQARTSTFAFATPPNKVATAFVVPAPSSPTPGSPSLRRAPSPLARCASPKPSGIPVPSPKIRPSPPTLIPQPRSASGKSTPPRLPALKITTSASASSGTLPPSLSAPRPVPKAIVRSNRCGHDHEHDDPCTAQKAVSIGTSTLPGPGSSSQTPSSSSLWSFATSFAFGPSTRSTSPSPIPSPSSAKIPTFGLSVFNKSKPNPTAYVSREVQLAKLRSSLEMSSHAMSTSSSTSLNISNTSKTSATFTTFSKTSLMTTPFADVCKQCSGPIVHL
jgi:hypothetical protein